MNIPLGGKYQMYSGLVLALAGFVLYFTVNTESVWLAQWLGLVGFTLFNFSIDKEKDPRKAFARSISFKAAGVFIVCFQLGLFFVSNNLGMELSSPVLLNVWFFNGVFFLNYHGFLLFGGQEVEYTAEHTVMENFREDSKLYLIWALLPLVVMVLIFVLK